MTSWFLATLAMMPAFAVPVMAAARGGAAARLVAAQLAAAVATQALLCTSFAFDQTSYVDLALTLALLGLPGTLLIAVFLERWL